MAWLFFFFKQKTAYEIRPRDWSSDVCSSDLLAPEVQDRKDAGDAGGEERHCLGEAVDRRAPALAQQQQDRRDERAGVADADPPDEVGDGEAPGDRDVDAPDADAAHEEIADRADERHAAERRDAEARKPPPMRR